ncbi:MAG TPA: FAD-dependent oxidoreductase, partial [Alphaproteobacteria bacterium]|nr:FAD-dependent oxidoreductase [Alphaproteobacteria bacterium]
MALASRVTHRRAPVTVIGSGAAGLACALALAPEPVLLLTKTAAPAGGSSLLSQGGIAAALGDGDSPARHAADTLRTGGGLAERARVATLTRDGQAVMRRLIGSGFPADRDAGGRLKLGREGAHGRPRIVHAGGDATGRNLV